MQEMQEHMNSRNDSGEFQEVESNHSGRLSYFFSEPAMIPSSRSMLSRDKRLPLDTWNTSGLQEFDSHRDHHHGIQYCADHKKTFLVINFLHLIRPKIIKKFNIIRHQERQGQFHKRLGRDLFRMR